MLVHARDENQEFLEKKLVKQFDYMTWHELLVLMFTTFFLSLQSNYRIKNVKKECKATCPQPAIASCIGVIDIRYFQSSKLCPMVQVQVWWLQNSYGRIPLSVSDKWDNTGGNFLKFNGLTCASLARHHQHAFAYFSVLYIQHGNWQRPPCMGPCTHAACNIYYCCSPMYFEAGCSEPGILQWPEAFTECDAMLARSWPLIGWELSILVSHWSASLGSEPKQRSCDVFHIRKLLVDKTDPSKDRRNT